MPSARRYDYCRTRVDLRLRLEDGNGRDGHIRQASDPASGHEPTVGSGPVELRFELHVVPGRLSGPQIPDDRFGGVGCRHGGACEQNRCDGSISHDLGSSMKRAMAARLERAAWGTWRSIRMHVFRRPKRSVLSL